jgi:hypothetical protein
MSGEPENPPIAAIFLGARIPIEHVGTVLRLLYSINADGFEIAPYHAPLETVQAVATLQLPDRTPGKKSHRFTVKPGSFIEFLLSCIRRGPKSHTDLRALTLKGGRWTPASLQPRLFDLLRRGLARRLADGRYVATPLGLSQSVPRRAGAKSQSKSAEAASQIDLILSHLKAAHPRPVPRQALLQLLAAHGRRATSIDNSITQLRKKGLVTAAGRGSYVYHPPKESVDAGTVP